MKKTSKFILYSSREDLMKTLQTTINKRISDSQENIQNNGIGKVVLGIRGIGKSYILQSIATHTGFCRSDLFVVYLNCEYIDFKVTFNIFKIVIRYLDRNLEKKKNIWKFI